MNMNMKTIILTALISSQANAVAIDTLFETADENFNGTIQLVNNDGKRMFVSSTMSKVEYIDGEKITTPLNKDNLSDWKLTITPPQMILEKEEKKTISLHYDCNNDCVLEEDQIYAINVSPVPYTEEAGTSVAIAFGYKVYFLVPATKVDLNYKLKRAGEDKFSFENKSNTMLNAVINVCKKEFKNDCIHQYRVLPGSKKIFALPPALNAKENINVTVINANETIQEYISL